LRTSKLQEKSLRRHRPLVTIAVAIVVTLRAGASAGAPACEGLVIESEPGSSLSLGWAGIGDDRSLPAGFGTSWEIVRRCSNNQEPCSANSDCGGGQCTATCDCNADSTCEIAGPVGTGSCATTLAECSTNADCPTNVACVQLFEPPIPLSLLNTPFCAVTSYDSVASGTFDTATGETSLSAVLRTRLYLGISSAQPCPRCGPPNQSPAVGDTFTCEGGPSDGATCTVEGVTPFFGGTSSDCAPAIADNIAGTGLVFKIGDLGTGTTTRTAGLQCGNGSFAANPLNPATNPKCTDDPTGGVCTSNADCRRCTGDSSIHCAGDGNCTGHGVCAEAPEQPVTCGYWCHCGFCNNDPAQPCFESSECSAGQTCQKGTGGVTSPNLAQQKPNDCSQDKGICGTNESERCEVTKTRSCSLKPYLGCNSNADCENEIAGTCIVAGRPCYESRITRSGDASPVGMFCAFQDKTCASNADCTATGDFCAPDSTREQLAGLFCVPASTSTLINNVVGLTGPADLRINTFVKLCRCTAGESGCESICGVAPAGCGNGIVDAGEDCDGGACCESDCSYSSAATTCRGSAGLCDVAETCSGSSAACPANSFSVSSTICRASAGVCDKAENCSGTSASCPTDSFQPNGTACDDGDQCTTDECVGGVCESTPIHPCNGQCGDGNVDEGEACDDGNKTFTPGEYCGVDCVRIPCGKPTNSTGVLPKSSDALFVLKAAVSGTLCDPRVCSVDGNQTVLASDALRILKAAVAQVVSLVCPT